MFGALVTIASFAVFVPAVRWFLRPRPEAPAALAPAEGRWWESASR